MPIFSLQVEKHVIGGLINNPQVYADVAPFLFETDFYNEVHSTIFCVLRDLLSKAKKVDKILVAEKIKNLGISFKDDINIYEYLDAICFTKITSEATHEACQELVKIRIRRQIFETAEKIKGYVKNSGNSSIDEIISQSDALYSEKISSILVSENTENLFEDLEKFVLEVSNNPVEENGFLTPYSKFNEMYGGLRNKNLYAFVSRPGHGKSTILSDLCFKTALRSNFKIRALLLDTEMETVDLKWRMVSSLSGVPMWYLETGNWRKDPTYYKLVIAALEKSKHFQFDHFKVGNKTIDQVCAIVRRWYYNKVGRGNPCIIAYDYVKITGEKVSENWKEHQVLGDKIDKLKKLSEEIDAPLVVAMQMNRGGESHNKKASEVVDDSSIIAGSDRLQWFASFVGIFRRKVIEEIAEDGPDFGTHKLIVLKTRFQGKSADGHQPLIKRKFQDGSEKYVYNYLNFDVKNFNVQEKGCVKDVMLAQTHSPKPDADTSNDGEIEM